MEFKEKTFEKNIQSKNNPPFHTQHLAYNS